jgi:hypothetical protein
MRTTQDYDVRGYMAGYTGAPETAGVGWVAFATIMLALSGTWTFIAGILAITSSHVYAGNANFVFGDLSTWGWIVLILGIVEGFATFALFTGSEAARWFGIGAASVNAIGQLAFVPAYPFWALAMFAVDVLVIYALAAHGGARLRAF